MTIDLNVYEVMTSNLSVPYQRFYEFLRSCWLGYYIIKLYRIEMHVISSNILRKATGMFRGIQVW